MALFKPSVMAKSITSLTPEFLKKRKINALLLDVDNTLSMHFGKEPLPGVRKWIRKMKTAGIKLMIISNARKSRVSPFAKKLDIPYYSLCKKPLPFSVAGAIKKLNVKRQEVMLCGDQLFTDMMCANILRIQTLLVEPVKFESPTSFKIRRRLEKPLVNRYQRTVQYI